MDDFVLLSRLREPNLESAVEHFSDFSGFCSIFRTARPEFGEPGRQKRVIHPIFYLLSRPHGPNLDSPVDKKESFTPFFVLFSRLRGPNLESPVDKKESFTPFFVYFRGHTGHIRRAR